MGAICGFQETESRAKKCKRASEGFQEGSGILVFQQLVFCNPLHAIGIRFAGGRCLLKSDPQFYKKIRKYTVEPGDGVKCQNFC